MTMEEYFQFLEQYWSIFTPPKDPRPKVKYTIVLL